MVLQIYMEPKTSNYRLVVSTHLKNISQNGNLPQTGVKIKNIWNHHLELGLEDGVPFQLGDFFMFHA